MTLTNKQLEAILAEAFVAGRDAASRKLDELRSRGPAFTVHDTGLFGKPTADNVVGTLLDVCGSAFLTVSGRSATHRILRRYLGNAPSLPGGGRVYYRPGYPTGFVLSIFDVTNRQELSVHEAAMEAVKDVLEKHGLTGLHVHSWVD